MRAVVVDANSSPSHLAFGEGRALARSDTGQVNEALCKVLCPLIQAMHALNAYPILCPLKRDGGDFLFRPGF